MGGNSEELFCVLSAVQDIADYLLNQSEVMEVLSRFSGERGIGYKEVIGSMESLDLSFRYAMLTGKQTCHKGNLKLCLIKVIIDVHYSGSQRKTVFIYNINTDFVIIESSVSHSVFLYKVERVV
jgi:hypothetical protein